MLRRLIKLAVILAIFAAPVATLVVTYRAFAHFARIEARERRMWGGSNAIKHAFAASETYTRLNLIFSDETSRRLALDLGEWNERGEAYIAHEPDIQSESYKDMRNNIYGVAGAFWLKDGYGITDSQTRLRLAGYLAARRELYFYAGDRRVPQLPETVDAEAAIAAIEKDEAALQASSFAYLDQHRDQIEKDLGLVSREAGPHLQPSSFPR
ncbi:hypothetical protein ACFPFW_02300 [Flaviflagellibacter deserti]|uniref:Uncharacterized protein n=1 Tax=Flaviflagellibacter deserti TaxID=2267266 RepID=A0ABV9YYD9_9HYPH